MSWCKTALHASHRWKYWVCVSALKRVLPLYGVLHIGRSNKEQDCKCTQQRVTAEAAWWDSHSKPGAIMWSGGQTSGGAQHLLPIATTGGARGHSAFLNKHWFYIASSVTSRKTAAWPQRETNGMGETGKKSPLKQHILLFSQWWSWAVERNICTKAACSPLWATGNVFVPFQYPLAVLKVQQAKIISLCHRFISERNKG